MSDDNQQPPEAETEAEPQSYRYFNKNNGHVVEYPYRSTRLENLQNWVTVEDDDHLDELKRQNVDQGRGVLGSSNVGDRIEPRHQVPSSTFEPKVEYTRPSMTDLPKDRLDPEEFQKDQQPAVITVDPSQQVQPKTGDHKRDLSAVVLDENLDLTPGAKPIGSGDPDGVLARAHPELEGVEERRQQLISEQQREQGDPDAGHTSVQETPADGDDASTKQGVTQGQDVDGPNTAERPARSAVKSEWVDWAVKCGADRDEAEGMTKQDLVDIYGGE